MRSPHDKSSNPPGGRAAERLRDFLEKRVPQEEVDAEIERLTNVKRKKQDQPEENDPGPQPIDKE